MTEDGIKIALTAEELELLKALAWTSGESSPELFARTQLLISLGSARLNPQGREKVRQLGKDLRRLHEELKSFLADGTSAPDIVESNPAMETSLESSASWTGPDLPPESELPYTSPTRFSLGRMTPSQPGALFPGYHRSSAHAPVEGSDDLEEMAGKAFAISPRLGAFVPTPPAPVENFAPAKEEENLPIAAETEPELVAPEPVDEFYEEPSTEISSEPSYSAPTNTVEIPKIDVPGMEVEEEFRFAGDPLVDLLDQELLKLVEAKEPVQKQIVAEQAVDTGNGQSFSPVQDAPNLSENPTLAEHQEGNSLADQVLESASATPALDNAELHQSLTEELVDWVKDLNEPVVEHQSDNFEPAPEPVQSSPFLSDESEPEQSVETVDHEKGIAATSSDPALLSDDEDDSAVNSTSSSESEKPDAAEDSTVLPRPPKIKPVELSGNSPPRKRRS